ncbi:MAG: DEAD/DEAH box helicase [Myxococcota bacterium]
MGEPEPLLRLADRVAELRRRLRADVDDGQESEASVDRVRVRDVTPPSFSVGFVGPEGRWTVELPLTLEGPPLRLDCDLCGPSCIHGLEAVDLLQTWLERDPEGRREEVERLIAVPPWQRFIETFDEALEAAEKVAASRHAVRFWWAVDIEALRIEPWVERPTRAAGAFARPCRIALEAVESETNLGPADSAALAAARVLRAERRAAEREGRGRATLSTALLALVDHPRVTLGPPGGSPWTVTRVRPHIRLHRGPDHVELEVQVGDRTLKPQELRAAARHPQLHVRESSRRLELVAVEAPVARLLESWTGTVTVPESHIPDIMARLSRAALHLTVDAGDDTAEDQVDAQEELVALLSPFSEGLHVELKARPLPFGPLLPPGHGHEEVLAATPDRRVLRGRRDLERERERAQRLVAELGLDAYADSISWHYAVTPLESAFDRLEALEAAPIECQWREGARWHPPVEAGLDGLRLSVRSEDDLLGLDGSIELDDRRIHLAVMLEAARRDRGLVPLGDGLFLKMQEALRSRLAAIARFTRRQKEGTKVALAGLEAVEELADAVGADLQPSFRELVRKVDEASRLEPMVPSALKGTLRSYQIDGFRWMTRLAAWGAGAVLADDMGLGKTIQAIAILLDRSAEGPQLVVAPTSVGFNWRRELERFAPSLAVVDYTGPGRSAEEAGPEEVWVTTYGVLLRDAEALAAHSFETVVFDEAQALKNPRTARTRAARRLRAKWRVALTGTPMENHPADLWSLFSVVFPSLLGSWERFREAFLPASEAVLDASMRAEPATTSGTEREVPVLPSHALRRAVAPYILRRTKAEVAPELPPRTEITVDVTLSSRERALYEDARLAAVAEIQRHPATMATNLHVRMFTALTRLRQLACHPRLVDPKSRVPSAKLERFLQIIEDLLAEGRRALVFSQFVQHLEIVREALKARGVATLWLDGASSAKARARAVDAFQDGSVPIFLVSLKAGGTGLNLTAADTVIHLDPWWNPAVEDQATDRTHRIGQTRPVTVLRLVTRDTVEPAILRMNARKRRAVAELMQGADAVGRLDAQALADLIRGAGQLEP